MPKFKQILRESNILRAGLVFAALAFVFLLPVVILNGYYAPVDIIRNFGLFQDGTLVHNYLLSDNLLQMLPWYKASGELIRQGTFPLWNIYSGGGVPLFANMQSAVLFPLTWLFYVFNFKIALFLYSFTKLFLVGLASYFYFNELGLKRWISIAGSVAFTYIGFNIVWLVWPLSGLVFLLPLSLFFVERYFNSNQNLYLLALAPLAALGVFAGHPETLFHIGILVAAYILFKLIRQKLPWQKFSAEVGKFILAGVLGAGLAAVQLLPFFEYLSRSQQLLERAGTNSHYLPKSLAVLNFIPDFLGNQAINTQAYFTTETNYNESTMGYIGLSLLFLSLVAVLYSYREPLVRFYAAVAALCFAVVYKAPFIYDLVVTLPGFQQGANHRLALFYGFSLIVLGCLALQNMISRPLSRKRLLYVSLVFLVIFGLSLWPHRAVVLAIIQGGWQDNYPYLWQGRTLLLFVLNLCLLLAILASRYKYRHVAIVALIVLETMAHGMVYNTVTRNKDFYPSSPVVSFLAEQYVSNKARAIFVGNILPPNLGTWYGINQVSEYDALGLVSYENYKRTIGDYEGMTEIFNAPIDPTALALGGVKYVVVENEQASLVQAQLGARLAYQEGNFTVLEIETLPRAFVVEAHSVDQLKENINKQASEPTKAISMPIELAVNGESQIDYKYPRQAYLVLNENYYNGWRTIVDNHEAEIIEVNGLKVIPVHAGEYKVKVFYDPITFRLGLLLSISSLLVLVFLGIFLKSRSA